MISTRRAGGVSSKVTERQFQQQVEHYLRLMGWLVKGLKMALECGKMVYLSQRNSEAGRCSYHPRRDTPNLYWRLRTCRAILPRSPSQCALPPRLLFSPMVAGAGLVASTKRAMAGSISVVNRKGPSWLTACRMSLPMALSLPDWNWTIYVVIGGAVTLSIWKQ